MTQDEIIEMAQECGLVGMRPHLDGIYIESLVAFAKRVEEKAQPAQPMHPEIKKMYEDYFDKCFRESSEPVPENFMDALKFDVVMREWVGLTDEEISDLWCKVSNTDFVTADTHVFARAIEAAHGIKESK